MPKERPLLRAQGLAKAFGGVQALAGAELAVYERELVALIGPNGAGKTTLFNCLTGLVCPDQGGIELLHQGQACSLTGLKPHRITQLGLARTFQNIRLFAQITVLENVLIGCHPTLRAQAWDAVWHSQRHRNEERQAKAKSYALLERFGLKDKAMQTAGSLAYADQRRLEIARALDTDPKILLLDEPAAGMNPQETAELDQLLLQLREEFSIAILLIEHDMKLVMRISNRVYVMDQGRTLAQGTPAVVQAHPEVIAAYLGEEVPHA